MRAASVSVVRADWEKAVPALRPLPQNKPRALHVREIWAGAPTDLERTARKAGLLD
jgi:hypothetical protein